MYRVIEVARMLGVSKVTIYKKMRFLKDDIKPFVVKEKNITHITNEGVELIKGTIQVQDYDADAKDSLKIAVLEKRIAELELELDSKHKSVQHVDMQNEKITLKQAGVLENILRQKQLRVEFLNQQLVVNQSITRDIKQQIALFDEMIKMSTNRRS